VKIHKSTEMLRQGSTGFLPLTMCYVAFRAEEVIVSRQYT